MTSPSHPRGEFISELPQAAGIGECSNISPIKGCYCYTKLVECLPWNRFQGRAAVSYPPRLRDQSLVLKNPTRNATDKGVGIML